MKLSHLYTNNDSVFTPIKFREDLNVVIARIQHPSDDDKSSHCLGKTLIIDVIDFCLLKAVGKKDHFLKTKEDLFRNFIFFLEIQLGKNEFVTVRRTVCDATKIAFMRHQGRHLNLNHTSDEKWDHTDVSLTKSVRMLNGYLGLAAVKPWSYRKGFSYFLRRQEDYANEFQLRKFMNGRQKDWKPYVARVMGFDEKLIVEKYEADIEEGKIKKKQDEAQSEATVKVSDYEKLQARILAKNDEIFEKVSALDRFDFNAQEVGLNEKLADEIEGQIVELNDNIYNAKFDLAQARRGLETKVNFNLDDIQRIFKEAELTFPEQLAKDYSDLVDFNKRIHEERHASLAKRCIELETSIQSLTFKMSELSTKRMSILKILGETDSLEKFKKLQKELERDRVDISLMQKQIDKIEEVKAFDDRLRKAKVRKEELTIEIRYLINNGSDRYKGIQRVFSRIIKDVLHRTAILYVNQNDSGNIEFHAEYTDSKSDEETQERRGASFRKILCIAFDISVLINYSKDNFFHFVYHDGALEQLELKRKLSLLRVVRSVCQEYGIQYIFSAIEEELPTVDDPNMLCPHSNEIVLELHDGGNDGRLFKIERF